jgi:hypothetical protein
MYLIVPDKLAAPYLADRLELSQTLLRRVAEDAVKVFRLDFGEGLSVGRLTASRLERSSWQAERDLHWVAGWKSVPAQFIAYQKEG